MVINHIEVRDYLTKSNLPVSDYVINPYVGCSHGCQYCYAAFMKRFTGHLEEWGSFVDVKHCKKPISLRRLENKTVFLSSVTDCYLPCEEEYKITRSILEQLLHASCQLVISTKSSLILRDLDLLRQFPHLKVALSVNTLDEAFRSAMDHAGSIEERLHTLEVLHLEGIHTVLFMSPIFPGITDYKAIILATKNFVSEYWFENLNLRGGYKRSILDYIDSACPELMPLYQEIYTAKDLTFWKTLALEMDSFCKEQQVCFTNYFYHTELVDAKKAAAHRMS